MGTLTFLILCVLFVLDILVIEGSIKQPSALQIEEKCYYHQGVSSFDTGFGWGESVTVCKDGTVIYK